MAWVPCCTVVACLVAMPALAQTADPAFATAGNTPESTSWSNLPHNVWQDQKALWTSPFRMNRQQAKWWLVAGGATAALVATDKWTAKQLPNSRDQIAVTSKTSRMGASYTVIPAAGALYFAGRLTHNERLRDTGILGGEALANAFLIGNALKAALQRERPTEGTGAGRFWRGDGRTWNQGSSFPSGHAITSWALASVVAHEYKDSKAVPVIAYSLAFTVSASRFCTRKHFASDVVVGSAMGWFIGRYVSHQGHNRGLAKVLSHIQVGAGN